MSTRRTRAHPSPGGLKSLPLEPPKRTRKQPARPARLRQTAAVAAKPVEPSEESITIARPPSPSPAPPTSRSQSPHILESDSQSAAIESRSSSPPTDDKSHWTRSQTVSTSPHSKHPPTQAPKRKTKATAKTTTRITRKRPRSQRAAAPKVVGSFPEEAEAGEDHSTEENIIVQDSQDYKADESSDATPIPEKSPARKYSRGRNSRTPQVSDAPSNIRSDERRSTPRKSADFSQQAGDTSDSDLADEERAPKRPKVAGKLSPRNGGSPGVKSSSRQQSTPKSPLITETKQIANTLENPPSLLPGGSDVSNLDVQGIYPRRELPQLTGRKGSPSKSFTTRSTRRVLSAPKTTADDDNRQLETTVIGPLPKDGEQRLRLWMDTYKIKPELLTSYRRGTRAKASSDSEEDDEAADSGDEYEKLTRSFPPQRGDRRIVPGRKMPFELSGSVGGRSQAAKDNNGKARLSTTTTSICETLTITSSVSQQKHVLTDPALIGFINQAISWFGADESRKVPSAEKFAAFLDGSAAPAPTERQIRIAAGVTAMQTEQASDIADDTETEDQPSEAASHIDENEQSDLNISEPAQPEHHDDSEGEQREEPGEVDATQDMETEEAGDTDTEHAEAEPISTPPQQPRGWMSPWTGVSAVANIFTTPLKLFGGRSQSASKASNRRVVGAATQPRKVPQRPFRATPSRRPKPIPQTERPRRYANGEKPPVHLRGLITPARIAEIQRKEDEMIEARRKREEEMAVARQKKRQEATVEEATDEEGSVLPTVEVDQTVSGQKRKRPYRPPRTPPRSAPGTFRVPSPSSSSEDDYSDEEPPTPTPAQVPKPTFSAKPVEKRLLGPSQTQLKYDRDLFNAALQSNPQEGIWQSCQSRTQIGAIVDLLNHKDDPVVRLLRSDRFFEWTGKGKRSGPLDRQAAVQGKIDHEKWIEDHNFLMECQKELNFRGQCTPVPRYFVNSDGCLHERFILPREQVVEIHLKWATNPLSALSLSLRSAPVEFGSQDSNEISYRDRLAADETARGFGAEERARPYTGKLFAQPKSVQANINDGKFPLAPRSDIDETGASTINNASSTPAVRNIFEAERLTKSNIDKLNEATTLSKENASPTKPIVFKAPSDSGSDTDEDVPEQPSTSALQAKKWTQTPPPKPRPSNASLPKKPSTTEPSPVKTSEHPATQQQTGDLARVRGAAEKFKPKQPSRLREVIQMSPYQFHEQESKFLALAREMESTAVKFDPAVMAALNAIPDKDLPNITIPFDYSQRVLDPLVQRELRMVAI
ncbi:hypothetical protein F5884DRAFT_762499 [Xylogone sp. PMI_703]|nr:hypothetical protein F5884DRAFT_762499 [Xylogone sp. PMI_703]